MLYLYVCLKYHMHIYSNMYIHTKSVQTNKKRSGGILFSIDFFLQTLWKGSNLTNTYCFVSQVARKLFQLAPFSWIRLVGDFLRIRSHGMNITIFHHHLGESLLIFSKHRTCNSFSRFEEFFQGKIPVVPLVASYFPWGSNPKFYVPWPQAVDLYEAPSLEVEQIQAQETDETDRRKN